MKKKNETTTCLRSNPKIDVGLSGLQAIVEDYSKKYFDALEENLLKISCGTITDCVCGAINDKEHLPDNAVEKYKKGRHQWRLTNAQINGFKDGLEKITTETKDFHSFQELYSWVLNHRTNGFGDLRCYDFSLCYGYNKGLRPSEFVYIHAGTKEGAKALKEKGLLHSEMNDRIPVKSFPKILQDLGAIHIENLLCIYKDALKGLKKIEKINSKIC